jgi:hypothetical protein
MKETHVFGPGQLGLPCCSQLPPMEENCGSGAVQLSLLTCSPIAGTPPELGSIENRARLMLPGSCGSTSNLAGSLLGLHSLMERLQMPGGDSQGERPATWRRTAAGV